MPPSTTRRTRTSTGPAQKGSQKTISFGNSKVSKPIAKDAKSSKLSKSIKAEEIKAEPISDDETLGHITSEAAVEKQAKIELRSIKGEDGEGRKDRSEEELKASKVTDAQIRKYWKEKENERRAPRVHQEDLSLEEKVLRLFDISSQYGPCIGIARMKRWVRANKLGLSPPIEVLAILLKEEEKGNDKIERAYVDELMSSKFVVGEA